MVVKNVETTTGGNSSASKAGKTIYGVLGFGFLVNVPKRSIHVLRRKQGGGETAIKSYIKRGKRL